jgi:hypothetical protein
MPLEGTAGAGADQAADPAAVAAPATGETTPSADVTQVPPQDAAAAATGDDAAVTPDPGLLAPEEFEKLKDDPKALIKALNRGFTTKMQAFANERKLIEAYNRDPTATIRLLAEHHGLSLGEKPKTSVEQTVDEITPILEEALGPDLAGKLKPAFEKLAEKVASTHIKPVRDYMDSSMAQTALEKTRAVMTAFETKHPDWKKHEPKMMEIAREIQPGQNADPMAYMEHLYRIATYDLSDADRVRGTIDRINGAASASDKPAGSVPGTKVAQAPKKFADISEATAAAFAAAKRGEKWERA